MNTMTVKEWTINEAQRQNVAISTIYRWRSSGVYDGLIEVRHINSRVVFVVEQPIKAMPARGIVRGNGGELSRKI